MKKLITLKGMGGLVAILTAMGAQVAHAGHYTTPVAGNGTRYALVDPIGEGHTLQGLRTPGMQPGTNPVPYSKPFPENVASVDYTSSWVLDGAGDVSQPTQNMHANHKFIIEGGPLKGSHEGDGSRSIASATFSPGGQLSVDSLNSNPNKAFPTPAIQTVDVGDFGPNNNGVITVTISVSASGQSDLTAVSFGSAKTEFNSLKVTSQAVELIPVVGVNPNEEPPVNPPHR